MYQLYFMGLLYTFLGCSTLLIPIFIALMPKFIPAHDLLIYLSGWAEIILGIGVCFHGHVS